MKTVFHNKRICGVAGIIPENEQLYDDDMKYFPFPERSSKRMKKVMGFNKHRLSKPESNTSDYCIFGLNYAIDKGWINKGQIGAIVVITTSPDYYIPHVSNIIHGECNLPEDVLCIDIPQGCCGFLMGLMESFILLDYFADDKKVVLFNTDVLSKKAVKQNRNNYPLTGDATTITVIENSTVDNEIYFDLRNDGKEREALIMPAGGFHLPCSEKTAKLQQTGDGNFTNLDTIRMDGTTVFNFVQTKVPPLINETLKERGFRKDNIDWFLFHQPNKFMLRKLADKLEIPYEKIPMDLVENYGNSGGATIPMIIVHTLSGVICNNMYRCCLSAFGSGLSWGTMILEMGRFDFCEMIVSNL